jgi:hypothetical protein
MPDPIAFMVMPFGRKPTGRTEKDVPSEVDFDALWERVYQPVLEGMGYHAVRADRDVGALIISQMIQRLAIADLVVADITLANANVYYEVGVRHAAMKLGCVLVSAEWARPVFDLQQMRQLRFPLPHGDVDEPVAEAARAALRHSVKALVDGPSPVFDAVPGFPQPEMDRVTAFADAMGELSAFEADLRAVRAAPEWERPQRVRGLLERYAERPAVRQIVAVQLMHAVRDHLGWGALLGYLDRLPEPVRRLPLVLEQRALALGKLGDAPAAIGQLEALIAMHGETAERLGLLGGRYKSLYREARTPADRRRYLTRAIESYQRGMDVDLNEYYPASNLPRLYRERGAPGDERRAEEAEVAAVLACRAALANGVEDEWLRPTLLGLAFDRGDVLEAIRLRAEIEADGPGPWRLESILGDLRATVAAQPDDDTREALLGVVADLAALAGDAAAPAPVPERG